MNLSQCAETTVTVNPARSFFPIKYNLTENDYKRCLIPALYFREENMNHLVLY